MLIERAVDFANGFRMRCEVCRTGNWLTAEDYAGSPDAMMTCTSCGDDFNFGPAVIELTDAEDPALDDTALPQLAWYHTTTDPEWPRISKPLADDLIRHLRERVRRSGEQIERHRRLHENQAIHLGTYEAAIDSMLRRMRDENDQNKVFYLHRVRLRSDLVIEPEWRDENSAKAAKITTFDLMDEGIDGIRYLNAYEAIGSLSLAVVRSAIESTQRVVVPVQEIVTQPHKTTLTQLRALRDQVHATVAQHEDADLTPLDKLRQKRHAREGRSAPLAPPETYDAIREMETFVADQYLKGLSPVARDDFLRSLHSARPQDDHEKDRAWLSKFMGLAALLTCPDEVQKVLAGQPWRTVNAKPAGG